jgi:fluoride exporter
MSVAIGVAVAGAFGSLARYGLDRAIEQRAEGAFPWSTFVINVTGCVLVGFLIAALVDRGHAPEWLRAALVVGFCGGFTTFSTFAQETFDLVEAREMAVALASVVASIAVGLLGVLVGTRLGRLV